MTIERQNDLIYFVYADYHQAEEAMGRLRNLRPKITSRGGHLNALVVDLNKVDIGDIQ